MSIDLERIDHKELDEAIAFIAQPMSRLKDPMDRAIEFRRSEVAPHISQIIDETRRDVVVTERTAFFVDAAPEVPDDAIAQAFEPDQILYMNRGGISAYVVPAE